MTVTVVTPVRRSPRKGRTVKYSTPRRARAGRATRSGRTTGRKRRRRVTRGMSRNMKRVLAMSQEQKMFYKSHTAPSTSFVTYCLGTEIIKGTNKQNRIGDHIHIKGVRIQYTLEQFGPTGMTGFAPSVYLVIGICRDLKRVGGLVNRWYLGNDDIPVSWTSVTGADKLIDRKNVKDIRIIHEKIIRADPAQTNASTYKPYRMGAYYVPLNYDLKYDNSTSGVPYALSDLSKEYHIYYYIVVVQNDPSLTASTGTSSTLSSFMYFRE